ncbi:putative 2,4-dihydroxyhept-2-ene-1,7-dioic acid-like aldolase [Vibrio nigripulchritudo SFn27]|uniref:Putative 2,4-dihydroxyhept-2-ene-1,7-dioic acid-like aldolase n=1 Tax=Vibrio nigripulchritudo TaxID=28173 RepID=U4K8I3_9VIBR|nr:4-hydroxy-2-oxoheptanedioate aldolase [Vibrio nigripulchritudo]CCN81022.1 putative 2,4-dihydroxyhept-2-ene-1,7-dioic acid-like aldolase [Vibrio nigripulchritudo BLFn1]CCN90847.1 putative 2,4-dihydroxyhept-2-ene-1,7-dioic acid-like aldolase [Vibrio nigripulchritudo SFn27]CCN96257.1 putative 2,4-dihydroxyhept-2-ene-1,7-dioic acid-like aldolase [Vibrio nigripulchritudo ENn2]CCO42172.1 putative 2,4-dihydroxyhept-2-ene-1,7-dioic acid-like aldolase [Vibrio nigripulchritudo SFn135]CCO55314.1 putat
MKNTFKNKLINHELQWGLWQGLPDPTCAEICAGAGFDWLLLDGEHAPFELGDLLASLRAIAPYSAAPIVRPAEGNTTVIKRLLDIGAQTLLIPMVDTAEQAQSLVLDCRYPPAGRRGMGSSLARAARWNQIPNYVHQANDNVCLLVQAETQTALDNLEAIVSVDGVDGVFIGPTDLSASMGHVGNPDHPDVVAAIEKAIRTIREAGKAAGILCLNPEKAQHYADCGASFIGIGVDTLLLSNGAKALVSRFKGQQDTAPTGSGY